MLSNKEALQNWKENRDNTFVTSMHISLLSYFRTREEQVPFRKKGLFLKKMHKHFNDNRSVKKHIFELIEAINDYQLGIIYIEKMGEFTHKVKKFQHAIYPFRKSNTLSNTQTEEIKTFCLQCIYDFDLLSKWKEK